MRIMKSLRAFGHRVIGRERADIEKTLVLEKKTLFGPRVLGTKVIPGTNTPAPGSEPVSTAKEAQIAKETISVASMQDMLEKNPKYIDHYIDMERGRVGGPRRKAVKIMLASERKNGRRAATVQLLQRMDPGAATFDAPLTGKQLDQYHREAGEAAGPLKPAVEVLGKAGADAE